MNKREFKDRVYDELAKITKALANPGSIFLLIRGGGRWSLDLRSQIPIFDKQPPT